MASRIRRSLLIAFALALAVATAAPAWAGSRDDWEPLIFELTLRGDIDVDDSFWIGHQCLDGDKHPECIFIHSVTPVCTSEEWGPDWGVGPCEARTYRVQFERDAGITIEYSIRIRDSQSAGERALLGDSVTLPEGGITLHLVYDYSLGVGPPAAPELPDTALATPGHMAPIGLWRLAANPG